MQLSKARTTTAMWFKAGWSPELTALADIQNPRNPNRHRSITTPNGTLQLAKAVGPLQTPSPRFPSKTPVAACFGRS